MQVGVGLDAREGAAEAAIQDHYLLPGPALVEPVQQPGRVDRGGAEPAFDGVGGSEVQAAAGVENAVAGEVDQDQVAPVTTGEEFVDPAADLVFRAVEYLGDGEPADGRIGEDLGDSGRILGRGTKPGECGIGVGGGGDDERVARFSEFRGGAHAGTATR
nr:hypothetical protein [Actinoplanes regularis]